MGDYPLNTFKNDEGGAWLDLPQSLTCDRSERLPGSAGCADRPETDPGQKDADQSIVERRAAIIPALAVAVIGRYGDCCYHSIQNVDASFWPRSGKEQYGTNYALGEKEDFRDGQDAPERAVHSSFAYVVQQPPQSGDKGI